LELNKIHLGDCVELVKELPDESIDLVVTSPPYYAGKEYEDRFKTPQGYDDYIGGLLTLFSLLSRVIKKGGHLWIDIDDVHTSLKSSYKKNIVLPTHATLVVELSKMYNYKEMILWRKIRGKHASGGANRMLGSYGRFGSPGSIPIVQECEYILWFKKGSGRDDITDDRRKESALTSEEFKTYGMQVWDVRSERAKTIGHPAPFPIEIPERIIKLSTFRGDVVLDPFMGSGTTALASMRTGRNWIGFEREQKYIDIAEKRICEDKGNEII